MRDVHKKKEVEAFLKSFKDKKKIWGVFFKDDRGKNFNTLTALDIRPVDREQVLDELVADDYSEGPKPEDWYGSKEMWVFGKQMKGEEIYIKITLGAEGAKTICISFHIAEYPMSYPLKKSKR
ncbi:type II toxin-antitoxin system MqsR family toxin [Marinoscillum furvescens]|uniref:MqsR (Motility quorum-sensing regulator) toxin of toxin-antitoxin system n=1 Tax=Marinoscillum furvescens DSM 4134 TaxID=1122208 RepID=A0A3D9KXU0_MARFU|nr:type II toxin-antitoxin system MqsR family toxin [Marinoscillum furvescens]RED91914.1 MqsR (Motility quorum-sensing regulator) toxin of toxin-antitoxin system [Marinoscillum furvescens DSM 4134]